MILEPYSLPDSALLTADAAEHDVVVWIPEQLMIVIGKGTDPALELHEEQIEADRVPVYRRGTGGCAVVLSPEMLVVSVALHTQEQTRSFEYFRLFNRMIIHALEKQNIAGLTHEGISDIALSGRKVAGTAIYRNRLLVFYHAVLNLAGGTEVMEKYLKFPPRTPDYRKRRSHREFVTSFYEQGYSVDLDKFRTSLAAKFQAMVSTLLLTQAPALA